LLKSRVFAAFVVLVAFCSLSARDKPQPGPILPEVTARGRALYEYDQAAWHATDAVRAMHPPEQLVGRYIAHKADKGWTVVFGRLNERRDEFLVAYEATQGTTLHEFTAKPFDPPQADASFYLAAAKAIDTALRDFQGEKRPYNVAVLPAASGQLYVYVMPAQTRAGIYPLGGDARYLISADGSTIVEKRQLHKTILETSSGSVPKGSKPQAGYHSHILSDVPEDTDVSYVLTRQPSMPEVVGTRNKMYEISTDGTIHERSK